MTRSLALLALLTACSSSTTGPGRVRFAVADPVTLVNDRVPTKAPSSFDDGLVEYYWQEDFAQPARRLLTVGEQRPAANINSLGEVPDSAWFTNRSPTPSEIERGPGSGGPDTSAPWHVIGVKVGGAAIGITIADARGDKYVLKFDERGHAETETSADVVVQRLTWAAGYNVPENQVVTFPRGQLVLDEKAQVKFRSGKKRPMTEADLERYLGLADHEGGTYRALASKLIGGTIVGGIEPTGTRGSDPNDRVPHELRRDLRGQRLLWAWVNHIDLKSQNSLASHDRGYTTWYHLDFGESLGVDARTTGRDFLGYHGAYAWSDWVKNLVTFGFRVAPYERHADVPRLRGLGVFEAETFDPATWVPNHNWRPTDVADRFDELWAAEILMRLSRAHVEAAVRAGKYTDPRTTKYLTDTLMARQRKIGRYAFSRVAPLFGLAATVSPKGVEVCFDDLWLRHAFGAARDTTYAARAFDRAGKALGGSPAITASGAHSCVPAVPAGSDGDGYTIVEITVARGGDKLPPLYAHVAGGRIVGLDRR